MFVAVEELGQESRKGETSCLLLFGHSVVQEFVHEVQGLEQHGPGPKLQLAEIRSLRGLAGLYAGQ